MRRELESRVEAVSRQALGSRALQVRAFRRRLGACRQLAECIPCGSRLDVLLAAQVRSLLLKRCMPCLLHDGNTPALHPEYRLCACKRVGSEGVLAALLPQLDPATALRAVDAGPPAESAQAAVFREFWGDRSELRRFQVGPSPNFCTLPPPHLIYMLWHDSLSIS